MYVYIYICMYIYIYIYIYILQYANLCQLYIDLGDYSKKNSI